MCNGTKPLTCYRGEGGKRREREEGEKEGEKGREEERERRDKKKKEGGKEHKRNRKDALSILIIIIIYMSVCIYMCMYLCMCMYMYTQHKSSPLIPGIHISPLLEQELNRGYSIKSSSKVKWGGVAASHISAVDVLSSTKTLVGTKQLERVTRGHLQIY